MTEQTEWYKYYYTAGECAKKFDMPLGMSVFRKFEKSPINYTGKQVKKDVIDWLKEVGLEKVGDL